MPRTVTFDSVEEFIKTLKEENIGKIAFCEVNERRAEQTENDLLEVIVMRKADVMSYKGSVIYKYTEKTDDLDGLYEIFSGSGFEVTRINKNIT